MKIEDARKILLAEVDKTNAEHPDEANEPEVVAFRAAIEALPDRTKMKALPLEWQALLAFQLEAMGAV